MSLWSPSGVRSCALAAGLESELKVAYLGPRGTFSEQAMIRQFGSGVVGMPSGSIEEVFRKVESGDAAYGIVPIENSTEGRGEPHHGLSAQDACFSLDGECSYSSPAQPDDALRLDGRRHACLLPTRSPSDNAFSGLTAMCLL